MSQRATNLVVPSVTTALARVTQRQFLAGKRSAPNFERACRLYLSPRFGKLLLTDVTSEDIEAYIAELRGRGRQPATINWLLHPLRAAFKLYAKECGISTPDIVPLEVRNTREVFFERGEFERVLAAVSPAAGARSLRNLFRFTYATGWRMQSEVKRLRWDANVRWDAGLVVIGADKVKNKRKKEFPFTALPEVEQLLREQYTEAQHLDPPCPWVFFRFGGKLISNCYQAWHGAVCRALCGCGQGRHCKSRLRIPHDLRRTAARNLQNAGVADSVIMDLCGWSTVTMLRRYLGSTPTATLRDAVARLAPPAV
jgi:integrase